MSYVILISVEKIKGQYESTNKSGKILINYFVIKHFSQRIVARTCGQSICVGKTANVSGGPTYPPRFRFLFCSDLDGPRHPSVMARENKFKKNKLLDCLSLRP